ncbi:UDP-glucoronosyl and UDP-glucosyl transferase [Musa troglodytarum]|uniref:Glycosyltransferase n=1 Tax=Musa troglodytarum TaxID=320322 RepID=A0A9E7FH12_9LILI|nr:UDP-glucoronosyl and UDP-glucosyl transferase [Musa troglodytarum]
MSESEGIPKHHALFVAPPFQGHFTPAANFAVKLAARGFIVTFVTTEAFHHQRAASGAVSDDGHEVFADARSMGMDIRYEFVSDGLPVSFDRAMHRDQFSDAFYHLLPAHVEELMRKLLLAESPIDVLISDTFAMWPSTLAKKFGLPYVSFWTEPALVFALYYYMHLLVENGHLGSPTETRKDTITYIPGVPSIEPTDLVSFFHSPEASWRVLRNAGKAFEEVKGANFVLCNTVQELEAEVIGALQQERPFYAVGPIVPASGEGGAATSLWPELDCSQWLHSMPPRSVLYVSFGSIAQVSKRDVDEIAYGVLGSKSSFIWVLRPRSGSSEASPLPEGFIEACKGRGIVVPWCRQKQVLLHPAVGGFLTHCGWNSILESMWCGVPMLCFPVFADQPTNRKMVVEDLRIGIDVGSIGEVSRAEVARRIDSLMGGEIGGALRKEMEEAQRAVQSAVAPCGSSSRNMEQFTADLLKHLSDKNREQ